MKSPLQKFQRDLIFPYQPHGAPVFAGVFSFQGEAKLAWACPWNEKCRHRVPAPCGCKSPHPQLAAAVECGAAGRSQSARSPQACLSIPPNEIKITGRMSPQGPLTAVQECGSSWHGYGRSDDRANGWRFARHQLPRPHRCTGCSPHHNH